MNPGSWLMRGLWCSMLVFGGHLALAAGPAEDAYRRGDHATAKELWRSELEQAQTSGERARLCYNCGNAAFRMGDELEAVAWYSAALRLTPRDADLWYNLELARAEAGLEAADRGDLAATTRRILSSVTRAESDWLVLAALVSLAVCLGGEALRGGLWRRASWLAAGLLLLSSIPWLYGRWDLGADDVMLVAEAKIPARSEPRPDAKRLIELEPGTRLECLDRLPGWVKVDVPDVGELWVGESVVFPLNR